MRTGAVAALALATLALAGCLGVGSPDPAAQAAAEPGPNDAAAPGDGEALPLPDVAAMWAAWAETGRLPGPDAAPLGVGVMAGCQQGHLYFTARVADFQDQVPEGFTIRSNDALGETFLLAITPMLCEASAWQGPGGPGGMEGEAEAGPASEMWIELPVVPPEPWQVEDHTARLALVGYVDAPWMVALLDGWGLGGGGRAVEATLTHTATDAGAVVLDRLEVQAEAETYTWTTPLRRASGDWPGYLFVRWFAVDGQVVGREVHHTSPSRSLGTGAVVETYEGPGAAPPLFGGIAHHTTGSGQLVVPWPLPAN